MFRPSPLRRHGGHGNPLHAREKAPGERRFGALERGRIAFRDDEAAVFSGARTHVDHVVGGTDRIGVVLDHEHAVAAVGEPPKAPEQSRVVARVQSDGRLVEHVENSREAHADLRREPHPLALAAREAAHRAVETDVAETDLEHELHSLDDLADHQLGDLLLAARELERVDPSERARRSASR